MPAATYFRQLSFSQNLLYVNNRKSERGDTKLHGNFAICLVRTKEGFKFTGIEMTNALFFSTCCSRWSNLGRRVTYFTGNIFDYTGIYKTSIYKTNYRLTRLMYIKNKCVETMNRNEHTKVVKIVITKFVFIPCHVIWNMWHGISILIG